MGQEPEKQQDGLVTSMVDFKGLGSSLAAVIALLPQDT